MSVIFEFFYILVLTRLFRAAESTQCHSETKLSTLKRTYGL